MGRHEKVLAVVPARGGSKSVPRKNIRLVCGKALIAYTIETALEVMHLLHRLVVSTDDEETAAIARQYGAEVPFLRPEELAGDRVPMLPVLQHAVAFVEDQDRVAIDWVLLLQPTAPFRRAEDIEGALAVARQDPCDSVISVEQVFAHHPILMKQIEDNRLVPYCIDEPEGTRRQDYQPSAYMRNGAIYLTRRDVLMKGNSIRGEASRPYEMPAERSVSIDSELDMKVAELMMQEQLEESSPWNSRRGDS